MKLRSLATLIALSSLLTTSISFGWDSDTRDGVRDMPIVKNNSFIGPAGPWVYAPDFPDYDPTVVYTTNLKDRVGGLSAEPGDATTVNDFYVCPSSFTANGSSLAGCRPAKGGDISAQWAWLRARKANDNPPHSEHYLIAKAAANLAGLSQLTLFAPFWIRYPTQNAYVASPSGDQLLVSQSWQPASNWVSSTQALRSISLLELAQLPDISNSLADWVEGNELCPLTGLEGAFTGSVLQNCHDLGVAMGAINATHFAPLNRQSWQYYHFLAMQRMAQCPKLAQLIQPFYTAFDPAGAPGTPTTTCEEYHDWYQVMHGNATEMHECEREAMAYEMFAQHFMQDSWSTGHMWKRWGKANFTQFDSEFSEYSGSATVPTENHAPRRAAIALMTAAISGEIHGAKSILLGVARQHAPGVVVDAASWLGLGDDPLCGSNYHLLIPPDVIATRDVEWRSNGGNPFPGAGDLFWSPLASSGDHPASVSLDDKYVEQRSRMLECSAASMLEAYNASGAPHAYGEPIPDPSLAAVKPGEDGCWDHWATNEAMKAAVGVATYTYDLTTQLNVANLANTVALSDRKSKLSFVKDSDTNLPHYAERRADREVFFAQLEQRMNRDMTALLQDYTQNAASDPKGLQSAHGIGPGDLPITMLGVGPIDTPPPLSIDPNAEPPTPPTDYSDRLVRQDTSDLTTSDAGSLVNAMSQLFWRGNADRTCRTSLLNNAQDLNLLREKCIAKAAGGGNPDACTACVQIAELHVPNISYGQDIDVPVGDSKCSALGVTSKGQVPAGLPAWWFDNYYRYNGLHPGEPSTSVVFGLNYPGFDVALTWCTGAELRFSIGGALAFRSDITLAASSNGWLPARDSEISYEKTTDMTCTDEFGDPYQTQYGISHRRNAQTFIEEYNLNSPNWVFPIVTAVDYTSEWVPFGQCGAQLVDSRAKRFEDATGDVNGAIYAPQSKVSHVNRGAAGISAPRCGVRQRMYYWNRPCGVALQNWKFPVPATFNEFYPVEGTEIDQIEYGQDADPANDFCLLREPRTFVQTCPDGMRCSANGECSWDDQATAVNVFPPPPPSP